MFDHLKPDTRAWCESVDAEYELDDHHRRLLALAGAAFDRAEQAREALSMYGLTYLDHHGAPKPRPEAGIENTARTSFARLLRELDLDCAGPGSAEAPRPPALRSNRRLIHAG